MKQPLKSVPSLAVLAACAALVAGCSGDSTPPTSGEKPQVAASSTQAADLARNIAGERATVTSLVAPGVDPHEYELRPQDMQGLTQAALVIRSGGDLDAWLTEAITSSGTDAPELTLIDHVETHRGGSSADHEDAHAAGAHGDEPAGAHGDEVAGTHGDEAASAHGDEAAGAHADEPANAGEPVDPHWWQDPRNAARAVVAIRDAMVSVDPAGRNEYAANTRRYLRELRQLDAAVVDCLRRVPAGQRKLVTTHDSLGYFARRYDIEVLGAVIPSLSTQAQASAGETAALVRQLRRERVRAIFTESAVNPDVERAIAAQSGARIGATLWADTLGPAGSGADTYLKSIAANARALASGFTDGKVECRLPS